jgi:hypothetical protein
MTVTLKDRLQLREQVVSRTVGDEAVILDLETGTYFGLDPVGSRFLELLAGTPQLAAVHAAMLAEYDVASGRLAADLLRIAEEMLARNLLARIV